MWCGVVYCGAWCAARFEWCVVLLLPCTYSDGLSLSRTLFLSLSYLSTILAITRTTITRPVGSLYVHTALTCPECQSVWTFTHSMFQRNIQITWKFSQGTPVQVLVSLATKWVCCRWSTGTVCVLHVVERVCLCVCCDISVAWWVVVTCVVACLLLCGGLWSLVVRLLHGVQIQHVTCMMGSTKNCNFDRTHIIP